MKTKRLTSLAAALTVAVCCTGPLNDDGKDIVLDGHTLLKADIEALALPGYDTNEQLWNKGDKLGLYSDEGQINMEWNLRRSSEGAEKAEFYGPAITGKRIAGYYPFDASKRGNVEAIPCNLPTVQTYRPELSASEYLISTTECLHACLTDSTLHFTYPFGLLKVGFDLYEDIELVSLGVSCDSTIISGQLKMAYDGSVIREYPGKKKINIDLGTDPVSTSEITGGEGAYVLIPPAAYNDMKVIVTTKDEKEMKFDIPAMEVKRIEEGNFTVLTVTISASGVDNLTQTEGYLEPADYVVKVFNQSLDNSSLEQDNGYLEPYE